MTLIRYAVRRARTASDKRNGKRWVAQVEFPGGRKIKLANTRNKPPALSKIRQEVRGDVMQAANAGAVSVPTSQQGSGGVPPWKDNRVDNSVE